MSGKVKANLLRMLATALALTVALVSLSAMMTTPVEAALSAEDGKKIAFTSDRTTGPGVDNPTGDEEIFAMNRDGTGLKQLTFNKASDEYPAYSPDGKHIAFSTNRDGNLEVYSMKADGSNPTNLTNDPANDFESAYSPDGGRIAFTTRRLGRGEVYEMKADGSNPTNYTNNPALDYEPAWQPKT
jgi:Tol biopolymer transport system component